mmetsp:Transcript_46774/g.155028  ORF Transcript_46774/g.155028 Transcript_46774/m.155028 type:complete len:248 (-) Transcript_46774:297-1040(-)
MWHKKLATRKAAQAAGSVPLASHGGALETTNEDDEYDLRVRRAEMLNTQQDYRQAAKALQRAIELNSTRPEAYLELASSHELSGDLHSAITACSEAFERAQQASPAWIKAASKAVTLGMIDRSEAKSSGPVTHVSWPTWLSHSDALSDIGDAIVAARPDDADGWAVKGFAEHRRYHSSLGHNLAHDVEAEERMDSDNSASRAMVLTSRAKTRCFRNGLEFLRKAAKLAKSDTQQLLYTGLVEGFEER